MKKVQLFILKNCPYCIQAQRDIETLKREVPYSKIEIEEIDEAVQQELANQYDYYYVPCFYIDGQKVSEGAVDFETIRKILDMAC